MKIATSKFVVGLIATHFALQWIAFFMELEDNVETLIYQVGSVALGILGFPVVTTMYSGGIEHLHDASPMWGKLLETFHAHFLLCFLVNSCLWALVFVAVKWVGAKKISAGLAQKQT